MADQWDIFGGTQALEPEPEPPKQRDASAYTQSRLFEPQMEGQLTLAATTNRREVTRWTQ